MKERPILMSAPMVRAILAERKTQTRRVATGFPEGVDAIIKRWPQQEGCPYGQPGDRLWVREAWRIGAWNEDGDFALDFCDGPQSAWVSVPIDDGERLTEQSFAELVRKGVPKTAGGGYRWPVGQSPLRWRPSIHMPRWASRLTLEITDIRVERLQEISEADAKAEGVDLANASAWVVDPREAYAQLWDTLNTKRGHPWESNPWVWVVSFRRVQP